MGVGRALLLTDRVRKDYKEARESGLGPVLGRLRDDAENLTGKVVQKVVGRPEGEEKQAPGPRPAADSEIVVGKPAASPAKPAAGAPKPAAPKAATPKPASKAGAKPLSAEKLPVSGYDQATLASVRARLRGLDAGQVVQLRDYEQAHQARADFLRMYQNRITKLKAEG